MAPWRYSDSYSVFDVFQTRILLEGEIARLAAGRLTQLQLDKMEKATRTMEECWASQDLLANVEADLEFHATIVSACSNAMLKALYQTVRDQLTETQRQPIPITDPSACASRSASTERSSQRSRITTRHGQGSRWKIISATPHAAPDWSLDCLHWTRGWDAVTAACGRAIRSFPTRVEKASHSLLRGV